MPKQITLYSAKICPYAQRVEIALSEAKAEYTRYEIDLQNKPVWFTPQVNPASKACISPPPFILDFVPAIAYGGPDVPPDQPSPDSVKLAESLVLVEFISDLFPDSGIFPSDPVERAQTRFFIDFFTTRVAPPNVGALLRGESFEPLIKSLLGLQDLLSKDGKYAMGDEFSAADIAVAPFILRLETAVTNELGLYETGEGARFWALYQSHPKFERLRRYIEALKERETVKKTYDPEYVKNVYAKRFELAKAQRKNAPAATATVTSTAASM
ncbi:glutathione S-transferase [Marasmius fiardii PR-910]|nr:glutathione S-transferase [Marasmius fiardii PR-910]